MESLIGKKIDNYEIKSILGKGGMGTVYKAVDITLEKTVAIKMIDPVLARDENFLRRFKTEAKALARLDNPNIVSVYTFRETEDGIFIVMEFVDAENLSEIIKDKGVFSVEDTIAISKQFLNALAYAHKVGIIHRDIKASNILLTQDGNVKVTDFGLAKVIQAHGRDSTVTQMRAGTLYYMSPEQVKGLKNVDKRSDVYSIGMTMYEMLAGKVPFDKTDSDFTIQKQIVDGKIPSLFKLSADLPKQLGKIIIKSLSVDPNKRYQSADEMLKAVKEYEQLNIKNSKSQQTIAKPLFKQPIFWILINAVLVLAALLFSGILNNDDSKPVNETREPIVTKISVRTSPIAATVFVNGDSIGKSPIENLPIKSSGLILKIQKNGFLTLDTSLIISKGIVNKYDFILKETSSALADNEVVKEIYGGVVIKSRPSGAAITINGSFKGTTPHKYDLKEGEYNLKISLRDYEDFSKQIFVQKNKVQTISTSLIALNKNETIPEPPKEKKIVKGTIRIFALPYGSIYIDDELKLETANKPYKEELQEGLYDVKVTHPSLGKWEKRIKITAEKTEEININFNKEYKITVISDQKLCLIFVDGKSINKVAPSVVKLRTGFHIISLKKEGYKMLGEDYTINIDADLEEPIRFKMKKIE